MHLVSAFLFVMSHPKISLRPIVSFILSLLVILSALNVPTGSVVHAQSVSPYGPVADLATWALDFDDEFQGFDSARWGTCPHGWTPPTCPAYDEALYQSSNVWVAPSGVAGDGMLVLTARREASPVNFLNKDYTFTSGFVSTEHSYSYKFGYLEARVKLPKGKGLWPALWVVSDSVACPLNDNYEAQSEIDLFEGQGFAPATTYLSLHWPVANPTATSCHFKDGAVLFPNKATTVYANAALSTDGYADGLWHVFGVDWHGDDTLTQFDWYVDGALAKSIALTGSEAAQFNARSLYPIANLGVGSFSNSPENLPDATTPDHATMLVDYVRVWKRTGPPIQSQPVFNSSINLISNGGFSRGTLGWNMDMGDATGTMTLVNDELTAGASNTGVGLVVHVANPGLSPQPWDPGLYHALPGGVQAGQRYELTLEAATDRAHPIQVLLQHNGFSGGGWVELSNDTPCASIAMTTQKQVFHCTFIANVTDPAANLVFRFGGTSASGTSVVLSYVSLKDLGAELIANGDFSQGQTAWTTSLGPAFSLVYILQSPPSAQPLAAKVHIDNSGQTGQVWVPALYQALPGKLAAGQPYRLTFTARSDASRTMRTALQHDGYHGGGWAEASTLSNCNMHLLTVSKQTFSCVFEFASGDDRANLVFDLGGTAQAGSNVYLDDVRLEPAVGVSGF